MKAVIMAAGKSTRTYPLTLDKPKPLLKVRNKSLLELNLDQLNNLVDEVILIIGYKSDLIKKYIGNKYKNLKITFTEQKKMLGTGHAALQVENFIDDKFILMNGDDFFHKEDLKECLKHSYSVLAKEVSKPELFGIFKVENNLVKDIVEKPKKFISNLANCGLYIFDKDIFPILKKIKKSDRGEYEVTSALKEFIKQKKVYCVKSRHWIPIGYPLDLLKLNDKLSGKNIIRGVIEKPLVIENSDIAEGTVIQKNSKIKNSSIGKNCEISGTIINSIIFDNSKITNSKITNSVVDSSDLDKVTAESAVIAHNCHITNTKIINAKIYPDKKISNKELNKDII